MSYVIGDLQRLASPAPIHSPRGPNDDDVAHLRALAREGTLARIYASAGPGEQRRLRGAAMTVAAPVVFNRLTRVVELRRGHPGCAVAISRLTDACLDRFHDDLEAVVHDLLRNATTGIVNLEGWLARRVPAATVDAHRRRRGARGAQQRPRLPAWLAKGLGHDPWLGRLAVEILTWAGATATAGTRLWPLETWSDMRATFTGTGTSDGIRTVEREVEQVLAVMRTRPDWYETYVERPLGAKSPPMARAVPGDDAADGPPPLLLVEHHEVLDAKLTELASLALAVIERQISRGVDLTSAAVDIIGRVFGPADPTSDITQPPHGTSTADEHVAALISDPVQLGRLVAIISDIIGRPITTTT